MQAITRYDEDMALIMQDPVKWAETHLGQKPRWYQEQILRHPHNRIVLRCGRRLGKCIAGTQRILNADTGAYETIESLFRTQHVTIPTLDDQYKLTKDVSFHIEENGLKPTFRITAKHGAQVELTGNHPVLTLEGWKEVDLLQVGDAIAVPRRLPVFGKDAPGLRYAKMLGYLTAALKETKSGPTLQLQNEDTRADILQTAKDLQLSTFPKSAQTHFLLDKEKQFTTILSRKEESIPKEVFTFDRAHLAVFLAALYDAKGWNYSDRIAEVGFGTKNRQFARDLKHLLLRFGIDANIIERKVHGDAYFQVMLYAKREVLTFIDQIGLYALKDYSKTREKAASMEERLPSLPKDIWTHIEAERVKKGMKKFEVTGDRAEKFRTHIGLTEDKALRYAENLQDAWLHDLATSDVLWEEVTSIEDLGEQMTYDVFMPKHHNLVVEDILVHNTWTMCAHMLWAAFTNLGGKKSKADPTVCLVATPYDNQARLIFDELRTFIDSSDILTESVKSITKNPYYIEFKNGATIKLFTAGTRAGAGGASLRGQRADFLYLDRHVIKLVPSSREAG